MYVDCLNFQQYEARQKHPPEIQLHPQIADCLVINNEGPNVISQVNYISLMTFQIVLICNIL